MENEKIILLRKKEASLYWAGAMCSLLKSLQEVYRFAIISFVLQIGKQNELTCPTSTANKCWEQDLNLVLSNSFEDTCSQLQEEGIERKVE